MNVLGKWAVIDIETSGIDANYDAIIDIGFYRFEGLNLVEKYSSLVQFPPFHNEDMELSEFIQKLTGIKSSQLLNAPPWDSIEGDLSQLAGHKLIAHNAVFEEKFLQESFERIGEGKSIEFLDSIPFLSLVYPQFDTLNLERFISYFGIRDKEIHRGLEDSLDLLKVLLMASYILQKDPEDYFHLVSLFKNNSLDDDWFGQFFQLNEDELLKLGEDIDFNLEGQYQEILKKRVNEQKEEEPYDHNFSLEFSGENVKNIFRDEETVKESLPFYTYRKGQEDLALRCGQSFKNDIHSLVQAPTGTGKTLGYLLPSALFSMEENGQILVATGTKALQQQAINKDVPNLRKLLGVGKDELRVTRLIGSGNHLCELLFRQRNEDGQVPLDVEGFDKKFSTLYFERAFFYNTRAEAPITRGALPYVLKRRDSEFEKLEGDIAVDFRSCTGKRCPYKGDCSYIKGLREAKDSHIIIGNHALMFSWPKGLPRPPYVVVDEAHKIEGETTKAFTIEVSQKILKNFLEQTKHLQGIGSLFYLLAQTESEVGESTPVINEIREEVLRMAQGLSDHLDQLPYQIELYFKKLPKYTSLYWNEVPMIEKENRNNPLALTIYNSVDSLKNIFSLVWDLLLPYHSRWDAKDLNDEAQIIAFTRFETFMGHLEDITLGLNHMLEKKADYTNSLKYHEEQGFILSASPINIGKIVHDGLLQVSKSVVFTSATLSNSHGDLGAEGMEWATGYMFLEQQKRFKAGLYLPPIYDYTNKTKIFLCDDLPPMYDSQFVPSALEKIKGLIRNLKGRSLLLFSAKKRFEIAREILLKEFEGEIPLFIQGMGNNVVEEFQNSGEGILLGMESFGEGIDIPGDALQFIFIDKIPDLRLDLVVNDRRDFFERSFGNEFFDYYLSHRTRSLHQKLGRLLRTENDFGGVIIADTRVKRWKGKTMEKVYRLMQPYKIERADIAEACEEIEHFVLKN